jgi:hypothetical protein
MAGKWQDKSFRYSAGSIEYVLEKVYAVREYSESPVQFWPRLWKIRASPGIKNVSLFQYRLYTFLSGLYLFIGL